VAGALNLCRVIAGFPWTGLMLGFTSGLHAAARKRLVVRLY
jgi:hypothetical protein